MRSTSNRFSIQSLLVLATISAAGAFAQTSGFINAIGVNYATVNSTPTITITGSNLVQPQQVGTTQVFYQPPGGTVPVAPIPFTGVSGNANVLTAIFPGRPTSETGTVFARLNFAGFSFDTNAVPFHVGTFTTAPTITSLNINSAVVGSGDFSVTATGTGIGTANASFSSIQIVAPGQSPVTAAITGSTATSYTFTMPSGAMTALQTLRVFVQAAATTTDTSNMVPFTIGAPSLTSSNPAARIVNTGPITGLQLNGAFPTPGAGQAILTVGWTKPGGTLTALTPVTLVSPTQVTVDVPNLQLDTVGSATLFVRDTVGRLNNFDTGAINFAILPPPTLTSLNPTAGIVGSGNITLTLTGTNLNVGGAPTVIWANGQTVANLPVTASSANSITATIAANLLTPAGSTAAVSVSTGGVPTNTLPFQIVGPPLLSFVDTSTQFAGSATTSLFIFGQDFTSGGFTPTVRWTPAGGGPQTLAVVGSPSDTFLTATLPSALLANPGTATVQVIKGGIASLAQTITILPSPVISSLNPRFILAGSTGLVLTVNGQNFLDPTFNFQSELRFGTTLLFPATVTNTQMTVAIPDNLIAAVAQTPVTVEFFFNGGVQSANVPRRVRRTATSRTVADVGSVSNVATFSVVGNLTLTSIFPTWIQAGTPNTQLVVTGTSFNQGSQILFGGTALSTVFNSTTQLTGTIPAALIATTGNRDVIVRDSFGRTTTAITLPVLAPIQISSLSPSFVEAGSGAFTLTINGSGFDQGMIATFSGVDVPTTFVSTSQMTASIPANQLTNVGVIGVSVHDARGRVSSAAQFNVVTPLILNSTFPVRANASIAGFTISVSGQGFTNGAVIRFGNANIPTTFVNSTTLSGAVPANVIVGPNVVDVRVQLVDGRISNPVPFTILPQLRITSITPPGAASGANTLTITVNGDGFTNESIVRFGGLGLLTTFVSQTQLTALVSDALLVNPTSSDIVVANPLGAVSNAFAFGVGGGATLVLTSVSPNSAPVGSVDVPVIVGGSGFTSGTVIKFGTAEIPTSFISPTQLNATIPAQFLTVAGNVPITATNGAQTSNALNFQVGNKPEITFLNPNAVTAGAKAFNLIVLGRGFVNGATIRFGDVDLSTTFASQTQLSAPISADLVATPRTVAVVVTNPDGQSSNSSNFRIVALSLTGTTPSKVAVGSEGFTLALDGTGFIQGATVSFGGTPLITTFGSSTSLSAAVPTSALLTPGDIQITVSNPDGAVSNAVTFTIEADTPSISRLNPSSVIAGSGDVSVNVIGGGFVRGSSVTANGSSVSTSFNSATSLDIVVPADLTKAIGSVKIKVTNPGNKESNEVALAVTAPTPAISRISPASANAGSASDITITVTGTGFVEGSSVSFGGSGVDTSFGGPTSLTATIPASALATARNVQVQVTNPGNLTSNTVTFQILGQVTVTAVSPSTIVGGGNTNVSLGVTGTGFLSGATVNFNGNDLATTFNSATSLTAILPPGLQATAGTFSVSVSNPNGATSNSVSLVIVAPIPPPPLSLQVPAVITPAGTGKVTVTLDTPAPVDLSGTLVLTFVPNANNTPDGYVDPALVFAGTGTRTITFTIAKGSSVAIITSDGAFSPGSVAGTVNVTMTSLTGAGQNLLPSPAPIKTIVIDRAVPVVVPGSVKITTVTGGFQVEASGISSVRDLRSITYTFTATGASILEGSPVTVDVTQLFTTYFASDAGRAAGGSFKFTMPFTVSGGDANGVTQVTVTMTNSVGTSTAVSGGR